MTVAKRTILVVAGILLMLGLAGIMQALVSQTAGLPSACGSSLTLKAGESETLRLTARAGAGFRWEGAVTGGGGTVAIDGGDKFTGNSQQPESIKADQVFNLRAVAPGEASVRFLHVQPFNRSQPIGDCTIKLKVE